MPRKYKRKVGASPRIIKWTEQSMAAAIVDMDRNIMGINEISRLYGIPSRTLRRRFKSKNTQKQTMGKHPVLGFENEKRLVVHIQKLEEAGFPPDRQLIRKLAYNFAEKMELKHNFNKETEMAGYPWLKSFLERNTELSVRIAEGLSLARAQNLNRDGLNKFYELLTTVLTENSLLDKPDRIFNMDETGIQLNNKPGKVIVTKGKRAVHIVTSGEKGETMTIIGCCNAIGNFLSPVVIIKGVNKKPEFQEGLPPGSKIFMNKKSAYINTELFHKWLIEVFIPQKPHGMVLLILDGHSLHASDFDMLQVAKDNDVILLCLPSHTTSVLQPLDRAVYKSFKTFFNRETNNFMRTNPQKKITRYNCAQMIGKAWLSAATPSNAISGFRGSGIFPVDPHAITDTELMIAESIVQNLQDAVEIGEQNYVPGTSHDIHRASSPSILTQDHTDQILLQSLNIEDNCETTIPSNRFSEGHEGPSTSHEKDILEERLVTRPITVNHEASSGWNQDDTDAEEGIKLQTFTPKKPNNPPLPYTNEVATKQKTTPSKYLFELSPIPKIPLPLNKRKNQGPEVLNSEARIQAKEIDKKSKSTTIKKPQKKKEKKKIKEEKGLTKIDVNKENTEYKHNNPMGKRKISGLDSLAKECKVLPKRISRKPLRIYSSSEDNDDVVDGDICCVCLENYHSTKSKSDWIQCTMCGHWLHESCSIYRNYCEKCGRYKTLLSKK